MLSKKFLSGDGKVAVGDVRSSKNRNSGELDIVRCQGVNMGYDMNKFYLLEESRILTHNLLKLVVSYKVRKDIPHYCRRQAKHGLVSLMHVQIKYIDRYNQSNS